ncbi:unnamed protein product [Vitrella brassicaformis CCMP3155]|uniref:C3H1-type domain-containing protein n=2 Tax=Vitrella brassicaformis TaxID=1169539 RepID=A0A0G4H6H6_VITBC|nr:unnamed protein product [Vitrella brassicaformis CCMP3155]|eukprot:CEM39219.1 unnamed protein product [Vitrella brassicaformis CCMP3155]
MAAGRSLDHHHRRTSELFDAYVGSPSGQFTVLNGFLHFREHPASSHDKCHRSVTMPQLTTRSAGADGRRIEQLAATLTYKPAPTTISLLPKCPRQGLERLPTAACKSGLSTPFSFTSTSDGSPTSSSYGSGASVSPAHKWMGENQVGTLGAITTAAAAEESSASPLTDEGGLAVENEDWGEGEGDGRVGVGVYDGQGEGYDDWGYRNEGTFGEGEEEREGGWRRRKASPRRRNRVRASPHHSGGSGSGMRHHRRPDTYIDTYGEDTYTYRRGRSLRAVYGAMQRKDRMYGALYKTELCSYWSAEGECRFGARCSFAHGKEELRTRAIDKLFGPTTTRHTNTISSTDHSPPLGSYTSPKRTIATSTSSGTQTPTTTVHSSRGGGRKAHRHPTGSSTPFRPGTFDGRRVKEAADRAVKKAIGMDR